MPARLSGQAHLGTLLAVCGVGIVATRSVQIMFQSTANLVKIERGKLSEYILVKKHGAI